MKSSTPGHLCQLAVAQVEHLADDRERRLVALGDIAQVQQRDQRLGIRLLRLQVAVRQHDHVVVVCRVQLLQQRAVGRIAGENGDLLVGQPSAVLPDLLLYIEDVGRPPAPRSPWRRSSPARR